MYAVRFDLSWLSLFSSEPMSDGLPNSEGTYLVSLGIDLDIWHRRVVLVRQFRDVSTLLDSFDSFLESISRDRPCARSK